jgi:hypothetical protein
MKIGVLLLNVSLLMSACGAAARPGTETTTGPAGRRGRSALRVRQARLGRSVRPDPPGLKAPRARSGPPGPWERRALLVPPAHPTPARRCSRSSTRRPSPKASRHWGTGGLRQRQRRRPLGHAPRCRGRGMCSRRLSKRRLRVRGPQAGERHLRHRLPEQHPERSDDLPAGDGDRDRRPSPSDVLRDRHGRLRVLQLHRRDGERHRRADRERPERPDPVLLLLQVAVNHGIPPAGASASSPRERTRRPVRSLCPSATTPGPAW